MQTDFYLSREEYLALDEAASMRHEYWDGRPVAMAGAEPEHNKITANLTFELIARLRQRGCAVMSSDQRVQVGSRFVYPDVVVTCAEEEYAETRPRTLRNPELIIEVLSPSTMERDMGDKLLAYTTLESLKEYWIVSSGRPLVMQYVRQDDDWVLHGVIGLASVVESPHFEFTVPLREVYALVFDSDAEAP